MADSSDIDNALVAKLGADFPVTLLATSGSDTYGATMLASG